MHNSNQQYNYQNLTPEGLNIYRKNEGENIRLQRSRTDAFITFYKYEITMGFITSTFKIF